MRKSFLIVPLFLFACASDPEPVEIHDACNFPEGAYTATYAKLDGECGTFEDEYLSRFDKRSWFPKALDLEDCDRAVTCEDGIITGSSYCYRTVGETSGTLDGTLTFDTHTNTGSLDLEIIAVNYHSGSMCDSSYEVTYTER